MCWGESGVVAEATNKPCSSSAEPVMIGQAPRHSCIRVGSSVLGCNPPRTTPRRCKSTLVAAGAQKRDRLAVGEGEIATKRESEGLQSLFRQPVQVADRGFINGQHRSCAVRFWGAARVAVVVGEVEVGEEPDVWIYEGG